MSRLTKIWTVANSPLVVALFSAGLIGIALKMIDVHHDEEHDFDVRRGTYSKLLTEYRHRMNAITTADDSLDWASWEPRNWQVKAVQCDKRSLRIRRTWQLKAARVGKIEADVVEGHGTYTATSPDFNGTSFLSVAGALSEAGGTPSDPMISSRRLLGFLDASPDILWLFVHADRPALVKFGLSREILALGGELPLRRNAQLTQRQERIMGIPTGSEAELTAKERKARLESERLATLIQNDSKGADDDPCAPSRLKRNHH